MKDYADFVRQQLLAVPLVSKVELFGVQDEKINIEFSHQKFAQLGVPIEVIANQIATQNAVEASGVLVTPTDNLQVRVTGALKTSRTWKTWSCAPTAPPSGSAISPPSSASTRTRPAIPCASTARK
jgi:multidrug efflux pump subunit AcrB